MTSPQRPHSTATEIPILDLGPYLAGAAGALESLARELRYAQEDVGFYFIVNHGIPWQMVTRAYDQLRLFFALPMEEKLKIKGGARKTGYIPPKSTIYVSSPVNKNTKPDLNEVVRLVRPRPDDHPSILAGRPFTGPNNWPNPALLPQFRPILSAYYERMEALGHKMLPLYARALDLPCDYFAPFFTDPTWTTRNAHYAPVEAEENQFGHAPHRDHSFLTLLPLSEEPGLQIQTRDGQWIAANQVDQAIIVNTGEFLNRWTNGRFIATPHRVVPPKRDRYSIAFFFNPSWDTLADPLPTCVGPERPRQFEPVTFLDYICWYVEQNYLSSVGGGVDARAAATR